MKRLKHSNVLQVIGLVNTYNNTNSNNCGNNCTKSTCGDNNNNNTHNACYDSNNNVHNICSNNIIIDGIWLLSPYVPLGSLHNFIYTIKPKEFINNENIKTQIVKKLVTAQLYIYNEDIKSGTIQLNMFNTMV